MNLLISFLDYLWIFWFSHKMFSRKEMKSIEVLLLLHIVFSVFIMSLTFDQIILHIIGSTLVLFLLMKFYKGTNVIKIQYVLLFVFIRLFSRILGTLLTRSFLDLFGQYENLRQGSSILEFITYECILIVILVSLVRKGKMFRFPKESSILVTLMLIIGIVERMLRFYHVEKVLDSSALLHLSMNLMVLLVCFILFLILTHFDKVNKSNTENNLLIERFSDRENYYKVIEEHNEQLQKIKHDFKNQLIALKGMVNAGDETCLEEIDFLLKECNRTGTLFSRHHGFQSILKQKFNEAEELGIEIAHDIHIPGNILMKGIEAAVLLGNLLDNAIESCLDVTDDKKRIHVSIKVNQGCLFIYMKNRTDVKDTRCITRKKDHKSHGHGIKNIRSIVKKYNGSMEMNVEEGFFETKIMLCDVI
ncbi:MAG: GHKL domain-containing protein [Lachnospiraceae bacterium]|nr:GHKL domain-containing protein [Lachnospiraceae bacterium]MDD3661215.1 GHKL domain-containing protein [Lachnospiraceae bacterium]